MKEVGKILSQRGKVIRDSVHGLIPLRPDEGYLLDLIDTPEFQRLRRIRQLGVSNITYPGAEHTRFSHSLGVLCFAGRILDHLKLRYQKHGEILSLVETHTRTVKAAALLHDTGHGPFSHMIERSFRSTASHEQRTALIITDPDSRVTRCSRIMKSIQIRFEQSSTAPFLFTSFATSSPANWMLTEWTTCCATP